MSNNGKSQDEKKVLKLTALEVSVNSVNELHTFRELTLTALSVQPAQKLLNDTIREIAPHYHGLAVQIETKVAADNAGDDKQTIAAKVKEIFDGYIQGEIDWLKSERNWDADSMPHAAKAAIAKISNALALGGSMRELQTVSQCEKFVRETRKAIARKAAEQFNKSNDLAGGGADGVGGMLPPSLGIDEEAQRLMANAMRNFEAMYQRDSKTAKDMLSGFSDRLEKAIAHAAVLAAGKVA